MGRFLHREKGQSNELFDPQYFSSFDPLTWATYQRVKIFKVLAEISQFFEISKLNSTRWSGGPGGFDLWKRLEEQNLFGLSL